MKIDPQEAPEAHLTNGTTAEAAPPPKPIIDAATIAAAAGPEAQRLINAVTAPPRTPRLRK
jgi:hypothetical protein